MNKKPGTSKDAADKLVENIRRKTRQTYSAAEENRIDLAGLRGEESISVFCRREGISDSPYYTWSKELLEAGKRRLSGDTARQATSPEVKDLRSEAMAPEECVTDLTLENVAYEDTDETIRMREEVRRYNEVIANAFIDIPSQEEPRVDDVAIDHHHKRTRRIFSGETGS
jgi:transposase